MPADGKREVSAVPDAPPASAMRTFTGGNQPQRRAQASCRRDEGERVWAREYQGGARFYVCATQGAMYAFVSQKPNQDLYEIIEDPAAIPVARLRFRAQSHLYLDIEYKRALNPDAPADAELVPPLLESLVAFVKKILPVVAKTLVTRFSAHSERKFSEHVCIRLYDADGAELWFEANWHAGAVVRRWEYEVARGAFPGHYMNSDSKTSEIDFVVDKGVYTRNRIFRTGSATKKGEARMLIDVEAPDGEWRMDFDTWKTALVQDHDRLEEEVNARVLRVAEASGAMASSLAIFYSPEDLALGAEAGGAAAVTTTRKRRFASSTAVDDTDVDIKRARTQGSLAGLFCNWIQSLHPDDHVEVRMITERTLVIHTDCHDCPIAGRRHSSNKIYYVVDDLGADYGDMTRLRCRLRCRDANCPPPQTQVEIPVGLRKQFLRAAQLMQVLQDDVDARSRLRFAFSAGF